MEIEKKFAIHQIPDNLEQYKNKKIEQGYLCHNPTIRIRKSNNNYFITYKSKQGIVNESSVIVNNEVELPLTKEAYLNLKTKIDGNMVYKTRYLIPLDNDLTVELDVFEGKLSGLVFAEVEFPDVKTAEEFKAPSWFGKDLSADKRFTNYHLSKLTTIEEIGTY